MLVQVSLSCNPFETFFIEYVVLRVLSDLYDVLTA